jgi:hypothetical protein
MKTRKCGLGKVNQVIIKLVEQGYFSTPSGKIFDPNHNPVKLSTKYSKNYKHPYIVFRRMYQMVYVHRFIAYELYGEKAFKKGLVVRHLDGNSTNNSHSNLKMGTPSQNMMDKPPEVRKQLAIMASRKANPRTVEQRYLIYEALCHGKSYRSIEKLYGVSRGTLSYMKNHSEEYKEYAKRFNQ